MQFPRLKGLSEDYLMSPSNVIFLASIWGSCAPSRGSFPKGSSSLPYITVIRVQRSPESSFYSFYNNQNIHVAVYLISSFLSTTPSQSTSISLSYNLHTHLPLGPLGRHTDTRTHGHTHTDATQYTCLTSLHLGLPHFHIIIRQLFQAHCENEIPFAST